MPALARSRLRTTLVALLAVAWLFAACGGSSGTGEPTGGPTTNPTAAAPGATPEALILARPYVSRAPAGSDTVGPMPLVILLHGYGASGALADKLFGFGDILDERGFLLATPDGTPDGKGLRFWNATDACCSFGRTEVDDVAYLGAVIDDMGNRYSVDPKRIFVVGHSNGGFMAHRLACDLSDKIAAIVSLAGAVWADPSRCRPTRPVAVAELHGTADDTILFDGGTIDGVPYPGARQTVAAWAARNGCSATTEASPGRLDLDNNVAGAETTVERHTGCPAGAAAELWTLAGSGHTPFRSDAWAGTLYDFLAAHPKP
jgi:polyhydroxybutyrate depolymerase